MTYETVVDETLIHVPELRTMDTFHTLDEEPPLAYVVFGSLLIPALEKALEAGDLKVILRICAFLEEASESSRRDGGLETLIQVEIGEWLSSTPFEEQISPWLGAETKRVCRYVPGLATQRLALRKQKNQRSIGYQVSTWWKKLTANRNRHVD
jgi:hypothetical protein